MGGHRAIEGDLCQGEEDTLMFHMDPWLVTALRILCGGLVIMAANIIVAALIL